jgi:hypothetical protein
MKRYHLFLVIGVIMCIIPASCISRIPKELQAMLSSDDDAFLGNEYFIGWDGKPLEYGTEFNRSKIVIDHGCIDYAHDERWIIVKTKIPFGFHKNIPDCVLSDSIVDYWLIDKNVEINLDDEDTYGHQYFVDIYNSNPSFHINWADRTVISKSVTGPLDSISFYATLNEKAINLSFKER